MLSCKKSQGKKMRIALLVVAGVALIGFLFVAVVLPQKAGADARDAAQALITGADAAKQQVAASVEKSGNLSGAGRGIKVAAKTDPKHGEMKWFVSENGDIRGWNERNALEVTITPWVQSGKANWNCKGYPVMAMPPDCGGHP
jgi:hypothetical protein